MEWISEYLLRILAVGVVCAICSCLTHSNRTSGGLIRMLCGIFLAVTLIAPLTKVKLENFSDYLDTVTAQASALSKDGDLDAKNELYAVIKEQVESYILDKANSLGVHVQVTASISQDDVPVPQRVEISGSVSPYHKKVLSQYIQQELGVPEAQQIWN